MKQIPVMIHFQLILLVWSQSCPTSSIVPSPTSSWPPLSRIRSLWGTTTSSVLGQSKNHVTDILKAANMTEFICMVALAQKLIPRVCWTSWELQKSCTLNMNTIFHVHSLDIRIDDLRISQREVLGKPSKIKGRTILKFQHTIGSQG